MQVPADAAGHAMPAAALASFAAHVLVLASMLAWPPGRANAPHEFEAQVEVVFGDNADSPGPPAGSRAQAEATQAVSPEPAVDAAAARSVSAAAAAHPIGGRVGLRVPHPDSNMIEAKADPGNRAPKYPGDVVLAGAQGEVVLRLHIGADGRVSRTELLRSSGHVSLDRATMTALARWRFVPALRDGVPVASYRDQATDFQLEGGR